MYALPDTSETRSGGGGGGRGAGGTKKEKERKKTKQNKPEKNNDSCISTLTPFPLSLMSIAGKHDKPWRFHKSHGMNIVRKSKQEVASLLHNPCATVGTERPLGQGEAMEVSVEPETANSQTQVKILLTHSLPSSLKLHNPCVYFSEDNVLNRLELGFYFVYIYI